MASMPEITFTNQLTIELDYSFSTFLKFNKLINDSYEEHYHQVYSSSTLPDEKLNDMIYLELNIFDIFKSISTGIEL